MCGICGFVSTDSGDLSDLENMASALSHRGPDDAGCHVEAVPTAAGGGADGGYSVGLGHRRLSIIDLSAAGHQPMQNEDGSVALVFNGEIYNFRHIRRELRERGHWFQSKTDSEVIIHGYEEWGLGVLDRLNGMFAFALWDRSKQRLVLARDRIGIKPLYYHLGEGSFLFASEIAALRRNPSFQPTIDREALGLYLDFSYVPAPKTIFRNTFKLLPGEALVWEPGSVRTGRYWSLKSDAAGNPNKMSFDEAKERCAELIRESVAMRLVSDVPLGAFLSGGYDSSLVAAMMKAAGAPEINTYSIGFEEAVYNEAPFARSVAEHLETKHHELLLTPHKAMRTISQLSRIYDEPFGDSSALPTYLVSKFARDSGMVVALSGDGGDELFCGYNRYRTASRLYRFAGVPRPLRNIGRALLRRSPSARFRRLAANTRFDSLADLYHQRMSSWKGGNPYSLVASGGRSGPGTGDAPQTPDAGSNPADSTRRDCSTAAWWDRS
jgi:asparagine synthase (glutamine-hydrolysing)